MRMRKVVIPALLVFALLTGGMIGVAAQEEPTMAELDIAGLEKWYGRSFAADMMAMLDPASPEAMPSGWWLLTTLVLEFDGEDSARAGVETLRELMASTGAESDAAMDDVELDLGDLNSSAQRVEDQQDGMTTSYLQVTAQDGRYVYAVVGLTFGEDPAPLIESVVLSMRDADVSDDEEMFHQDGASTGGLWAKLPTVEDISSQAQVLTVAGDAVYYPLGDATPAA